MGYPIISEELCSDVSLQGRSYSASATLNLDPLECSGDNGLLG
jgi:hypothetical protein